MVEVIMLVGLAGSGKSTIAKTLSSLHNANIFSSDDIRKELFNDVDEQGRNVELFDVLHNRVIENLKNGKNSIIDATNISYKRRMAFLNKIRHIKCKRICCLVATPYEDCISQDLLRDRQVGEDVIKKMYLNFYVPNFFEGWDDIQIMWNFKKENFNVSELFAGKNGLDYIDQQTPYHKLTIGKHCSEALIYVEKQNLDGRSSLVLKNAAYFHDIGKPFVKEWNEEKQRCTYHQHHLVSAYNSLFYLKQEDTISDMNILEVCNLIQFHMRPYSIENKKSEDQLISLLGEKRYNDLKILHQADLNAH